MKTVYVEKDINNHPRTIRILNQVAANAHIIECDHYKEVFNPQSQNFRIQKENSALILAQKKGKKVLPTPQGFGIGGQNNYYFSHMMNCVYDCRYCFLQGMYSSANYVVFVNYEDFMEEINFIAKVNDGLPNYFFSGYDCDSLAFEPVTHFLQEFLPFFHTMENAVLELRTKSVRINELLKQQAFAHGVVGFSFTPHEISIEVEHKVPSVAKRLLAMKKVAEQGWPIGLRFDPLIYHPNFKIYYQALLVDIFKYVDASCVHSISFGPLRFPEKMYQKIVKLYPNDKLLSQPLLKQNKIISYPKEIEDSLKKWLRELIKQYVRDAVVFACYNQ